MTAQNGEGVYGDGAGVVTPIAHKLSQNGPLVKDSTGKPRSGVFYAGTATLVTGKANMSYDVAVFEAAICRGRTKGTSYPTNDAVVNVTTTAAPGSNKRIDIIYAQQQEVSEGDAATQFVIGVVQGDAAPAPTPPPLPDGAIELARAEVAAGITATTSATITQTAPFTAPLGSPVPFRTTTEMNVWTPVKNQLALDLSTDVIYRYNGTGWRPIIGQQLAIATRTSTTPALNASTFTDLSANANWTGGGSAYSNGWVAPFTGTYQVGWEIDVTGAMVAGVTVNKSTSVAITDLYVHASADVIGGVAAASATGLLSLTAGDVVRLFAIAGTGTPTLRASIGRFTLMNVG